MLPVTPATDEGSLTSVNVQLSQLRRADVSPKEPRAWKGREVDSSAPTVSQSILGRINLSLARAPHTV
jgi:hypothetical protein